MEINVSDLGMVKLLPQHYKTPYDLLLLSDET